MTASLRLESLSDGIRRHQYLILGIILLFSIAVRLPVIMRNPLPAGDGIASNLEVAVNLRQGLGFSTMRKWTLYDPSMDDVRPEGNRQPVMGVLLFLTFLVSGPGFLPAQLLSLTAGIFCLFSCWIWARKTFGTVPALFTAAVLSVNPLFVWFSTQPDSLLLFTGLFFAVLTLADVKEITPGRAVLLGLLVALSYLARTQGLILAFSTGLWILIRGGKKRIVRALLFAAVFLAACAPWFLRNINAFGSPTYTQGGQFLLNENHWAAWEVR